MNINSLYDIIERIRNSWEKWSAILLTIIIFNILYLNFLLNLILPEFKGIEWVFKFVIPISISVCLYTFWLFNTNRLFIQKNKTFVLGIFLKVDENETEYKIKKIVNASTNEINKEFNEIKVKVFPINYKKEKSQIEKYLRSHSFLIDAILFATVESGKQKTEKGVEEKIVINQFSFIGNFNVNANLKIFNSSVNLAKDLNIRLIHKDWAYIEDNNIVDKKKLKLNLRDTILHYSGIYLIYLGEFKLSLKILKTLFNVELSTIPNPINGKIKIPKESLAACRLNNIILNLFYLTAIRTYIETNDSKEAYKLLKDCEKIFSNHSDSYDHYIPLARFAYENDKLEEAIEYTNKAKNKKGETIEVLVNLAFFAIVESNVIDLVKWYKKIRNKRITYDFNFVDVIEFLESQRDKLKNQSKLIDFSVGALNKLHLDTKYGQALLEEFITGAEHIMEYEPLVSLAKDFTQIPIKTLINSKTNSLTRPKKRKTKRKKNKK